MGKRKQGARDASTIALNKKARHDYAIEETYEAGLALEGWEVKSLRDGRVQLRESWVAVRDGEAWLLGCHVTPMPSASTHVTPDPVRPRKLLLHREQIDALVGATERKGYTLVPTRMYWKRGRAKVEVGTARGKKLHDKRASARDRDWERQRARLLKAR